MKKYAVLAAAAAVTLTAIHAGSALAQGFPSKPVRIIVPYGAGGSTDATARVVAASMTGVIGQPVVVGGNKQFILNLEYQFKVADQFRAVVFFDAGNAFNTEDLYCNASRGAPLGSVVDPCSKNPLNLRTSYGVGVRWFSPLGPLRFEWGFPVKPLAYEDKSVFEFTIGNFF